ncbi:hypothetical protein Trydic_g14620 [Trypoxylus dichotomus]
MNAQTIPEEWGEIKNSINIATEEVIGMVKRNNRYWFNDDYQVITKQKTEASLKWINTNKEEGKEINKQNDAYKGKTIGIKDKGEKLVENAVQFREVWKLHFRELLYDLDNNIGMAETMNEANGKKVNNVEGIPTREKWGNRDRKEDATGLGEWINSDGTQERRSTNNQ